MTAPACVRKKVLVSGATPFDPQNKIAPFQAAACETTNREYSAYRIVETALFYFADPMEPPLDEDLAGPYQPVANVSAKDALRFCQLRGGRLPTNDEWEKMARGPQGFDFGTNDGTLNCGKSAQCDAGISAVVGSFAASGFGTYDAVGNVWELTMGSYGDFFIRGGSWHDIFDPEILRADYRLGYVSENRDISVGFRCVWSQDSLPVQQTNKKSR